MRILWSVAVCATLSACGGASGFDPVVQDIVLSNSALTAAPEPLSIVAAPELDGIGDITFGNLLNDVRAQNGAPPVAFDARLNDAAQSHAEDLLANDYLEHVGLDGSTVGTRVQDEGYNFARVGENIASGYSSEQTVLNGWVNSPDHQVNNIDPRFEDFGLGYVRDGGSTRWVLVLGKEQ